MRGRLPPDWTGPPPRFEIEIVIDKGGPTTIYVYKFGQEPRTYQIPSVERPPESAHPRSLKRVLFRWQTQTRGALDGVPGLEHATHLVRLLYPQSPDQRNEMAAWFADNVPATPEHVDHIQSEALKRRWVAALKRTTRQPTRAAALRQLLIQGFILASDDAHKPQGPVRLGRHWILDPSGRRAQDVIPARDISDVAQLSHWLVTRAFRFRDEETRNLVPQGDAHVVTVHRKRRPQRNWEEEQRVRMLDLLRSRGTASVAATGKTAASSVRELLAGMPPARRSVAKLLLNGRSVADIAGKLGLSESTVRSHIAHAVKGRRRPQKS